MNQDDLNRIIEMAWEDRTPFDIIYKEFDISQNELERLKSFWKKNKTHSKKKHSNR